MLAPPVLRGAMPLVMGLAEFGVLEILLRNFAVGCV